MTKEQILAQFGLSEKQAKVYVTLLELGESRIGPLAARSGIKRTSIYNFITELVELGIITKFEHNSRDYYRAEDPKKLQTLYEQRGRQLAELLPELELAYQAAGVMPTRVSYYRNVAEMKQLLFRPLHESAMTIDWLWARDVMKKVFAQDILDDFKRRREGAKIFSRVIQPRSTDASPPNPARDKKKHRERRFAPKGTDYHASIMIFSNSVSFISSRRENFGVLIESKEFAEACRVLFNGFWQLAEKK